MACHNSTILPGAGSHTDLDFLADSKMDLTSWLFTDDLYQQDFGKGAKEMHSSSSALEGHASPPCIATQDLPDWMEASTDINWDQPMNFEDILHIDPKQQQVQQPLTPSYNAHSEFTSNLFVDPEPPLDIFAPEHQYQCPEVLVEENETKAVVYSREAQLSPEGFENSSSSFHSQEESLPVDEVKPAQQSTSPFIISVPLTEVFPEKKPIFKTINITGIEHINVAQKPVFYSTPIQSNGPSTLPSNERREPQQVVINLRRITRPVVNNTAVVVPPLVEPQPSGPTLKEVLTRGDSDDLIRDLVIMPTHPFDADRQEKSVLQSSEDFEDRSFGSTSLLQFSPSPNSCNSSACSSIRSPESYDSQDYSVEEDDLSQDIECSSSSRTSTGSGRGDSQRYAPYKSLEKKLRKKEQNKRAALRYRQKKKDEEEVVLTTLQKEEERGKQLTEKYNAVQMEMKLLKKLMREMLVSKGAL